MMGRYRVRAREGSPDSISSTSLSTDSGKDNGKSTLYIKSVTSSPTSKSSPSRILSSHSSEESDRNQPRKISGPSERKLSRSSRSAGSNKSGSQPRTPRKISPPIDPSSPTSLVADKVDMLPTPIKTLTEKYSCNAEPLYSDEKKTNGHVPNGKMPNFDGLPSYDNSMLRSYKPKMESYPPTIMTKSDLGFPNMVIIKRENTAESFKCRPFHYIEIGARKFLWRFSKLAGQHQILFIIIPLIISAVCMAGLIARRQGLAMRLPFSDFFNVDAERATTAASLLFNSTNYRFDTLDRSSNGDFSIIIKTLSADSDVLREDFIDRYLILRQKIEEIGIVRGPRTYKYDQLCRHESHCDLDVLETILNSGEALKLHFPETRLDKKNKTLFLGYTFGGVTTDAHGTINTAQGLAMHFKLQDVPSDRFNGSLLQGWATAFKNVVETEKKALNLDYSWWSTMEFTTSVIQNFGELYRNLAISCGMLIALCICFCLTCSNYSSKPWLGLAAGITCSLITLSGLAVTVGRWNELAMSVYPLMFFLAGIAAYFLMEWLEAWRKYSDIAVNPLEKLRFLITIEGPLFLLFCPLAIVATGITTLVTTIPLLQYTCQMASVSMFLLLIYGLTLYTTTLYLTGKRELSGLKWFMCWSSGDDTYAGTLLRKFKLPDLRSLQRKLYNEDSSCCGLRFGKLMSHRCAKYVVIPFFVIYLIFAVWGCTGLKIKVDAKDYVKPNTNLYDFLTDYATFYGKYDQYIELNFVEQLNYYNPEVRESIDTLLHWVQANGYSKNIVSWLRSYVDYSKTSIFDINADTFLAVLRKIFLKDATNQAFGADLAFDRYNEEIIGSRMFIELNEFGVQVQPEILNALKNLAQQRSLPLIVKAPSLFLQDHDIQIFLNALGVLILCPALCVVLSIVFLAQPFVSILLMITLTSIIVGTLGLCALWTVPLSAPNVVSVLSGTVYSCCITLACCYHFMNNNYATARQRTQYMFTSTFSPGVKSAAAIIISFLPILAVNTGFTWQIAKLMYMQVAITLFHCYFLLPPCLALLTLDVPKCMKSLKKMCHTTCNACFGSTEDTDSIYFIPTRACPMPIVEEPIYVPIMTVSGRPTPLPPPPGSPPPVLPLRLDLLPPEEFSRGPSVHMMDEVYRSASMERDHQPSRPPRREQRYRSMRMPRPDADFSTPPRVSSRRSRSSPSPEKKERRRSRECSGGDRSDRGSRIGTGRRSKSHHSPRVVTPDEKEPEVIIDSDGATEEDRAYKRKQEESLRRPRRPYYEHALIERPPGDVETHRPQKMSYSKWSREVPVDPYTAHRITAEKYMFSVQVPPVEVRQEWRDAWLRGSVRRRNVSPYFCTGDIPMGPPPAMATDDSPFHRGFRPGPPMHGAPLPPMPPPGYYPGPMPPPPPPQHYRASMRAPPSGNRKTRRPVWEGPF